MKKFVSVLVCGCLGFSLLSGCGESEQKKQLISDSGKEEMISDGNQAGAEDGSTDEKNKEYDFSDRPHYTIKIMMFGDANTEDCDVVAEKLSEITEEKLNADVELTRVGFGSFETQLNLALSSGEELDLFNPHAMGLTTLVNNGQVKEMNALLDTYGTKLKAMISEEDWLCNSVNGKIYAVPSNKEKAHGIGFVMRKDILDETGTSIEDIKSLDDLHDVLLKVKELHPELYPVVTNYGALFNSLPVDSLGDSNNLGVLVDPYNDTSLTVENLYASDFYKELCETMYQWNKDGLIMPDGSTNSEGAKQLIKAGKGFGQFNNMQPGMEIERSIACGTEMVCWEYKEPISMTSDVAYGMCISENSGDPERAMALLELMYTDPEVSNLVINGIEGRHYTIIDSENHIIDYPEGKDISNVGYSRYPYGWPNQQISMIWNGYSTDIWDQTKAFNENAKQSPAKGFIFDSSQVLNEITACTNVVGKYNNALLCGSLNPDEVLQNFINELEDSGIDRIIKEKQSQLDEWSHSK